MSAEAYKSRSSYRLADLVECQLVIINAILQADTNSCVVRRSEGETNEKECKNRYVFSSRPQTKQTEDTNIRY